MRCPFCGNEDTKVVDSRNFLDGSSIKRRRECAQCGKRFTTYEKIEVAPIFVVKKDGRRERFDREKLLRGLTIATIKREISRDTLEAFVDEIEKILHNSLKNEITTSELGEIILQKLKEVDEVAYVRFASVYMEFNDIKSFIEIVEKMKKDKNS